MLKRLLVYLLLLLGLNLSGQVNLVQNGNFEDISQCPTDFSFINYAIGWFRPSNGSPDLYNVCGINNANVPDNGFGFQYPQDGNGYCGGAQYYDQGIYQDREYIAERLITALKPNHYYCFKMYVSQADLSNFTISSIGAYFSKDSVYIDSFENLPWVPQIENNPANFIADSIGWQLIEGVFKADGGEKYIYIGNFKNNSETVYYSENGPPVVGGNLSYIYYDNIQLYECDTVLGLIDDPVVPLKIYPNPATNTVSISMPKNYPNPQLYIYNLTGQLVATKPVQANQPVPITELNAGIYIFAIHSNNTLIGREKVVVY